MIGGILVSCKMERWRHANENLWPPPIGRPNFGVTCLTSTLQFSRVLLGIDWTLRSCVLNQLRMLRVRTGSSHSSQHNTDIWLWSGCNQRLQSSIWRILTNSTLPPSRMSLLHLTVTVLARVTEFSASVRRPVRHCFLFVIAESFN